ncbi:hypothetical protein WG66_015716 [Moniliophthora roreri]|uniref:Putative 15-O-acetyltransferase Tri3 n=1 Tax=Moniliophthora roreri TaxID=221103 RepID=A0A0W0FAU7_MONRR|nr:hypothetical protein WG66_015716 [Moniliophthora roreri]
MSVSTPKRFERQLGDTEVSYFLPSREDGVNDMYLHLGFHAPEHIARRSRVSLVWAILRLRHPLLASAVSMKNYDDIKFVYECPSSVEDALERANDNLAYQSFSKDEMLDWYLNGPRTLSNERLSYLVVSQVPTDETSAKANYDICICATHFLGDGMALHTFANDFFQLLCNNGEDELRGLLQKEWILRCHEVDPECALPRSLEERLPSQPRSRFYQAASRIDFQRSQDRLIGGHTFPKRSGNPRHTIVPTVSFDEDRTKKILKNCKAHGVSISSALFAICSIAWAKTTGTKFEFPIMMYSALNLRPYLAIERPLSDSYWFISIGYFNVILPTFLPKDGDLPKTFWHRAYKAKEQSARAAKSPMLISRSRHMAQERGARARVWGREDDEKAKGTWIPPPSLPTPPPSPAEEKAAPKIPSAALIGLSLLGNLDGMYKHGSFPDIKLHTLTTGSRQRPGGMLLFGYTFVGKLWVSLGYDKNGFDQDVVDRFWANVLGSIDDLL